METVTTATVQEELIDAPVFNLLATANQEEEIMTRPTVRLRIISIDTGTIDQHRCPDTDTVNHHVNELH